MLSTLHLLAIKCFWGRCMYTVHQTVLVKPTDLIDFHFPDSEVGEGHRTGQRDHNTTAHLKRLVVLQGPVTLTLFLYWVDEVNNSDTENHQQNVQEFNKI